MMLGETNADLARERGPASAPLGFCLNADLAVGRTIWSEDRADYDEVSRRLARRRKSLMSAERAGATLSRCETLARVGTGLVADSCFPISNRKRSNPTRGQKNGAAPFGKCSASDQKP